MTSFSSDKAKRELEGACLAPCIADKTGDFVFIYIQSVFFMPSSLF